MCGLRYTFLARGSIVSFAWSQVTSTPRVDRGPHISVVVNGALVQVKVKVIV